jgi:hypothetical protein
MAKTDVDAQEHDLALEFADALRGHRGAKAMLLDTEQRDGASWSVVRVSFGGYDTYDAFIDPSTGALDGFRITEDRKTRFERRGDWRVVDGVRMAFSVEIKTDLPGGDQTAHLETIELNRAVPDSLFARPAAVHKASFRDGATSTGWIPFEFFGGNRIYFPVKVNGREVVVLLDSGAETSVIDKSVAKSIGLEPKGEVPVVGSGGAEPAGVVSGVTIEVGNLKLSDLNIVALDLQPSAKRIGHPLSLVLGGELFREFAADIDFAHRRIAFRDPEHLTKPEGAQEIPLTAVEGIRSIPVSVEGGPSVQFDFDLGSGSPLLVFPAYYKAHDLLAARRTSKSLGGGAGGVHPETMATIRKVEIAGVDFTDVPTRFTSETTSGANNDRTLGNVGLPILSRFHLVIDFSHDRVWMTPEPRAASMPFEKDRMGLSLQPKDGAFEVEFVSPASPADAAGLKAGDHIKLIDRKPPEAWPAQALRGLGAEAAGTRVELTMADGSIRRLVLADYF